MCVFFFSLLAGGQIPFPSTSHHGIRPERVRRTTDKGKKKTLRTGLPIHHRLFPLTTTCPAPSLQEHEVSGERRTDVSHGLFLVETTVYGIRRSVPRAPLILRKKKTEKRAICLTKDTRTSAEKAKILSKRAKPGREGGRRLVMTASPLRAWSLLSAVLDC